MTKRLTTILILIILAMVQLTFSACDSAQNRAKKIVSLRSERKKLIDTLYQAYGGSDLSQSVTSGLQRKEIGGSSTENQIVKGIANLAQSADRTVFEQSVRIVGSGENLITVTDKSKQFFSRIDVIKYAKRIYEIDVHLEQLERQGN